MEYGQFHFHIDEEDENLHLKCQGGGGSNPNRTKVRAILVKIYAAIPYMMVATFTRFTAFLWNFALMLFLNQ